MTTAPPPAAGSRDDVRVARVHLRMGQLTLARAELEDLLRRDQLDVDGLAVLAEARWRTGDTGGAADAAFGHLDAGGADEIALCIAAESVAADGRPAEARALMERLPASDAATLDALFAGMPRRAFWPAGPVDRSDLEDLRPGRDARAAARRAGGAPRVPGDGRAPAEYVQRFGMGGPADLAAPDRSIPGPREVMEAVARAGWDRAAGFTAEDWQEARSRRDADRLRRVGRRLRAQLDPAAELEKARAELATAPEKALVRLSLALRLDPTLAPAVLEVVDGRRETTAALVRGDAQRLLGRHLEAEAAFDAAAESLEVP